MKELPLSQGKVAIVDDEDYEWLRVWKWTLLDGRTSSYAFRNEFPSNRTIYMHRVILNPPSGVPVDHINGNGLDNRRSNLRLCTNQQNSWNRRAGATVNYKGAYFNSRHKVWQSKITVNGKQIYLGTFEDELSAALAHDAAARQYHGEFARLNFPET